MKIIIAITHRGELKNPFKDMLHNSWHDPNNCSQNGVKEILSLKGYDALHE